MAIKKIWTYKLLIKFLYIKINNFNNNIHKNLNFDIKFYLVGLTFNRFIFNIDKMVFMISIITNFLLFLCWKKGNFLFIGNPNYKDDIESLSKLCKQQYYDEFLLDGSFAGTTHIINCYNFYNKPTVFKNIDCLISFSSSYNHNFIKDVSKHYVPTICLITELNEIINYVTYPIFIKNDAKFIYFFCQYFSRLLCFNNILNKNGK